MIHTPFTNPNDLETLITQIVQRLLSQWHILPPQPNPNAFFATFGTWEDDRSADEIIQDIYSSRTHDPTDSSGTDPKSA